MKEKRIFDILKNVFIGLAMCMVVLIFVVCMLGEEKVDVQTYVIVGAVGLAVFLLGSIACTVSANVAIKKDVQNNGWKDVNELIGEYRRGKALNVQCLNLECLPDSLNPVTGDDDADAKRAACAKYFKDMLGEIRANYAADSNAYYNNRTVIPFRYRTRCKYEVLNRGTVYYGCLVQANSALFTGTQNLNSALPAVYIYSPDEAFQNPKSLLDIADKLISNKTNNFLKNESDMFTNIRLSDDITFGKEVYATVVFLARWQVPLGVLSDMRFLPIIADPASNGFSFAVDCRYWPAEFVKTYFFANHGFHDDAYGDPFDTQINAAGQYAELNTGASADAASDSGSVVRKLTVTRQKAVTGCAVAMNVYVQCNKAIATTEIDGKHFRRIDVKNGGTITTEILVEPVLVYMVIGKAEAQYIVEPGACDVCLNVKPRMHKGNFIVEINKG